MARALTNPDTRLEELARQLSPAHETVQPGEHAAAYKQLYHQYLEPFEP